MADYTGTKCIVCNEKFAENDDIVVCPDCGTPYHRECYKKENKCLNTALHESRGSWSPKPEIPFAPAAECSTVCRRCGHQNREGELFCERCGFPMQALEIHNEAMRIRDSEIQDSFERSQQGINLQPFLINFSDPLCGYNPEEEFDGVRLCELGDYVESNTHYYLPAFKKIKETGKAMTWNFAAMIFPEFYFANRKMPLIALGVFAVRFLAILPYYISVLSKSNVAVLSELARNFDIRGTAFQLLNVLSYAVTYGVMFFCGAFANWIYYRRAVRKTAKIKSSVPPHMLRETLRRKGGTSAAWLVTAIMVYCLPYLAVYYFQYFGMILST